MILSALLLAPSIYGCYMPELDDDEEVKSVQFLKGIVIVNNITLKFIFEYCFRNN